MDEGHEDDHRDRVVLQIAAHMKDGAPVGVYSASLTLGNRLCSQSFRVEEYRVPTFQVSVSSIERTWKIDPPVRVKAAATYLKGGKLDGRAFTAYSAGVRRGFRWQ